MVQYKAAPGITSGMKGTAHFGIESLADRRWSQKLFFLLKIIQGLIPSYLRKYSNAVSEEA